MVLFDDELGFGPGIYSFFRHIRDLITRRARGGEERSLDPMAVDREAWRAMRHGVRRWPDYREAPNTFRVLVSQADWDEYWGVDTDRKADSVARYLLRQAADRDLWIAGTPEVSFSADEEVARGGVRVSASFAQAQGRAHKVSSDDLPEPDDGIGPASAYEEDDRRGRRGRRRVVASPGERVSPDATVVIKREQPAVVPDAWGPGPFPEGLSPEETVVLPRPTDLAATADDEGTQDLGRGGADVEDVPAEVLPLEVPSSAYLRDDGGFRMLVHPGDVIGAVREGEPMDADVNIRLDGRGFPGVEARQLSLAATADGWTVTDLAESGTRIEPTGGDPRVLGPDETAALSDGDVVYLGPERPLRFEFGE